MLSVRKKIIRSKFYWKMLKTYLLNIDVGVSCEYAYIIPLELKLCFYNFNSNGILIHHFMKKIKEREKYNE